MVQTIVKRKELIRLAHLLGTDLLAGVQQRLDLGKGRAEIANENHAHGEFTVIHPTGSVKGRGQDGHMENRRVRPAYECVSITNAAPPIPQ